MSTLAIQAAQTGLRIGAQIALTYAQSAISHAFDTRRFEGPRLEQFRVMSSTDGAPLPRAFGRVRLGGQVIWASNLREVETEEKVGKGGPSQVSYSYTISFAVALCEGEIAGVERIWANGELLATQGITYRVHRGTPDQMPDPVIVAIEGEAPAYRGAAYLVFEDFPLDAYGARLPQINTEVIRPIPTQDDGPKLEDLVTGVNLLPGSGEFAYHTSVIEDRGLPGGARPINVNSYAGIADAVAALDQLERDLPNCKSVSIISSWFGTDLRLGQCEIHPGVETTDRVVVEGDWQVSGLTRADAYLVSRDGNGNPVYGGTPSDAALIELIAELKSRGFEVCLYPFILMDVPPGNGLPDPYGGEEQAAFPWRGRITATGDATTQSRDFFGDCQATDFDGLDYAGPDEFSFRRFILHHAAVARAAGGVDRFLIGSEMREMTQSSAGEDGVDYPAVDELIALAAEVRAILPGAQLSYAADWSEYFGHHAPQGLRHHLDPLWADANIDCIAIDAYFPLADWRQEADHIDARTHRRIHDLSYLQGGVEGGEGYDWYYASDEDRDAQLRTPIDQARFRYKDVRHFWSTGHSDDRGPTPWVPTSKPVWFSEVGCPAVDLGANQPNVFVDPKSSESFLPHYSSGRRDDLIKRNYLRAFLGHYQDDPMVDGLHVWCWDARPFPDFPARTDVWADGPNWQLGHWLNGRTGRIGLGDIIKDICRNLDVEVETSGVVGLVEGMVIDRPMSARAALSDLCAAFAIDMIEQPGRLMFRTRETLASRVLTPDMRADGPVTLTHAPQDVLPGDVRLRFIDSARDHQQGLASGARRIGAANPREISLPVVMDEGLAESLAANMLDRILAGEVEASLQLSPDVDIAVGDVVTLDGAWRDDDPELAGGAGRRFLVTSLEDSNGRSGGPATTLRALSLPETALIPELGGRLPGVTVPVPVRPAPALFAFNLPDRDGLGVGVMRDPFAPVTVSGGGGEVVASSPVHIGWLASDLAPARPGLVIEQSVEIDGMTARLDSVDGAGLLSGAAHRFAVETASADGTGWEIVAAREAELIGPLRYRLTGLLRGLSGMEQARTLAAGARIVHLGAGVSTLDIAPNWIGQAVELTASVAGRQTTLVHEGTGAHLRPWSPVHIDARRTGGRVTASWIRRSRAPDSWQGLEIPLGEEVEVYRVELMAGKDVLASTEVATPSFDMADAPEATHLRVRQGSQLYGWGRAGTVALPV